MNLNLTLLGAVVGTVAKNEVVLTGTVSGRTVCDYTTDYAKSGGDD